MQTTIPELTKHLDRLFKEKDGYIHTGEELTMQAFRLPVGSAERQSLTDQGHDALVWAYSLETQINQAIRELEKVTAAAGWK